MSDVQFREDGVCFYKQRRVGVFRPDRVFVAVKGEEHYFRSYHGFGINAEVLRRAANQGCTKVVLIVQRPKGDDLYHVPIGEWLRGTSHDFEGEQQMILNIGVLNKYKRG